MVLVASPSLAPIPIAACSTQYRSRNHIARRAKSNRVSTLRVLARTAATKNHRDEDHQKRCEYFDLHNELVPYGQAWAWQRDIVGEKKSRIERNHDCPDTLIVLQHHPVYTMGTGSSEEYLNFDINHAPYDIYRTERGGEVTYHGPGQIVMYPIINLRNHKMDLHWYLRSLEEVVIRTLSSTFSIKASRVEGLTGVWVGNLKLAAIGIRVSSWITYHGLALNVTADLAPFKLIIPCGIRNRGVGSLKGVLGETGQSKETGLFDGELIDVAHDSLIKEFAEVFQLDIDKRSVPVEKHMSLILDK